VTPTFDEEDVDPDAFDAESKRQMIYELEASGLSIREIAQKMGIGQDEVRTFLSLRKV
jgi:DNA-directed RNA polymerase specialized sigma24 family protein